MKEMLGEKRRQACYGCDQGRAPSYTRLTSIIPKTLRTYHKHSAPAILASATLPGLAFNFRPTPYTWAPMFSAPRATITANP